MRSNRLQRTRQHSKATHSSTDILEQWPEALREEVQADLLVVLCGVWPADVGKEIGQTQRTELAVGGGEGSNSRDVVAGAHRDQVFHHGKYFVRLQRHGRGQLN